jgi:hypothetical protein
MIVEHYFQWYPTWISRWGRYFRPKNVTAMPRKAFDFIVQLFSTFGRKYQQYGRLFPVKKSTWFPIPVRERCARGVNWLCESERISIIGRRMRRGSLATIWMRARRRCSLNWKALARTWHRNRCRLSWSRREITSLFAPKWRDALPLICHRRLRIQLSGGEAARTWSKREFSSVHFTWRLFNGKT